MRRPAVVLACPLLFLACLSCRPAIEPPIDREEAVRIADSYVEEKYPLSQGNPLRPRARDQGDSWIVTYALPEGSVGGTPTVEVDKKSGKVLHARHSQ